MNGYDFLIIANPVSGARAAPQLATRVKELLKRGGRSVELKLTTARGQAALLTAEAVVRSVKTVIGCGGDGTLQEIATALDGSATSLGILPSGRCNDFALALGLNNKLSPEELAGILLAGRRRIVDLGAMAARRFLTVATLGFDSEVSRFVETRDLWLKGAPAYLYGVARVLLTFKAPLVKLKGDFGVFEGRILLAATGNSPCYGGALRITPDAKLDDGVFQICVVGEVSKFTVLRIMPRVMNGTHTSHPAVKMLQTRSLEIETPERPMWICADGESLGQTPCKLEVRPGALQVLV
ncbi:MAG: diacylglycerol kinase family protein [Planctomycetota bacterium]